jgi:hypothetical protein
MADRSFVPQMTRTDDYLTAGGSTPNTKRLTPFSTSLVAEFVRSADAIGDLL